MKDDISFSEIVFSLSAWVSRSWEYYVRLRSLAVVGAGSMHSLLSGQL